jgi:hypothetical protein
MTPGQRHAVLATAALAPAVIYQAHEIAQGDEGYPFSRFLRLLPVWLFLAVAVPGFGWFVPHICGRKHRGRR